MADVNVVDEGWVEHQWAMAVILQPQKKRRASSKDGRMDGYGCGGVELWRGGRWDGVCFGVKGERGTGWRTWLAGWLVDWREMKRVRGGGGGGGRARREEKSAREKERVRVRDSAREKGGAATSEQERRVYEERR